MSRFDGRSADQLRPLTMTPNFQRNAAGSVLIACGNTRVLCAVTVEAGVPRWMKESGKSGGWITGEYGMLPASTDRRKSRPIGKTDGRSTEIQRLIGRSLRAMVDLSQVGAYTYNVDCDVIDADGGTRCAAITGASVALRMALRRQFIDGKISSMPTGDLVAAVSVGMVNGEPLLDLCYEEDSAASVDMNVIMTEAGRFVEVQGTGEEATYTRADMNALLDLAEGGIRDLVAAQRTVLEAR